MNLINQIKNKLYEDIIECREYHEKEPTKQAIDICLYLTNYFSNHHWVERDIKLGVFIEDTGGISFVLQSIKTDKRINFRINNTGKNVTIITVDKNMKTDKNVNVVIDESMLHKLWLSLITIGV